MDGVSYLGSSPSIPLQHILRHMPIDTLGRASSTLKEDLLATTARDSFRLNDWLPSSEWVNAWDGCIETYSGRGCRGQPLVDIAAVLTSTDSEGVDLGRNIAVASRYQRLYILD